jgi:hypothetical protein
MMLIVALLLMTLAGCSAASVQADGGAHSRLWKHCP